MRASELVTQLVAIILEHGDTDVLVSRRDLVTGFGDLAEVRVLPVHNAAYLVPTGEASWEHQAAIIYKPGAA